jgi:hypothetical protein
MFRKAWGAVCAIGRGVSTAASYSWFGVKVAYAYTVDPMFNFIEKWVPGAACVREVFPWYLLGMALVSMIIVGSLAIEAGYGLLAVPLMIAGAVLVPLLVFSTPAFWPQFIVDMWFLSVLFNLIDAIEDTIRGRAGFLASFAYRMWPGVGDYVTREDEAIVLAESTA